MASWARWISIDRKSTRLNSSHLGISYAVFWLKKRRACAGRQPIPDTVHDPGGAPRGRPAGGRAGEGGAGWGGCPAPPFFFKETGPPRIPPLLPPPPPCRN